MSVFLVSFILACSAFLLSVGLVAGVLPVFILVLSLGAVVVLLFYFGAGSLGAVVVLLFFWCCVTGVILVRCELLVFVFISGLHTDGVAGFALLGGC